MQFRDESADLVLDVNLLAVEDIRFLLASSADEDVLAHFSATFDRMQQMKTNGYSPECIKSVMQALYEILLEMRVRGFEADYAGIVYRPAVIVPVPEHQTIARRRQTERLKRMSQDVLRHLCDKTRKLATKAASQESKGGVFAHG